MQSFSPKKIGTGEIATAGNSSGRDVFRSDVCRQIRRSRESRRDSREGFGHARRNDVAGLVSAQTVDRDFALNSGDRKILEELINVRPSVT